MKKKIYLLISFLAFLAKDSNCQFTTTCPDDIHFYDAIASPAINNEITISMTFSAIYHARFSATLTSPNGTNMQSPMLFATQCVQGPGGDCANAQALHYWAAGPYTFPSVQAGTYVITFTYDYSYWSNSPPPCTVTQGLTLSNPAPITMYLDADGDGYGNPLISQQAIIRPPGYIDDGTDCNDNNNLVHVNCCNSNVGCDDNNPCTIDVCNEGICCHSPTVNCDDGDPDFTDILLYINGACICRHTNDSLGITYDDLNPPTLPNQCSLWYHDGDGDNYYTGSPVTQANSPGTGWTSILPSGGGADCNDNNSAINRGATEICGNGIDENCNGMTDDACSQTTWYQDIDGDGYAGATQTSSTPPAGNGWSTTPPSHPEIDCDDLVPAPVCDDGICTTTDSWNAAECHCDFITPPTPPITYYADLDEDGFGDPNNIVQECVSTPHVTDNTDCNDNCHACHPGGTEICDNNDDENCNGMYDGLFNGDYSPSLAVAIIEYFPNVGIGCPGGARFEAIFALQNCYTTWTLHCAETQMLGYDSVWTANKGEHIFGTVPSGFANPNIPGVFNRHLNFLAVANGSSQNEGIWGVSFPQFNASANCDGEISVVGDITPETSPGSNGSVTYHLTASACNPWSVTPWHVRLTSWSTGVHYFGQGNTINQGLPVADNATVIDLPAGTYDVGFDYGWGACRFTYHTTVIIPSGITTGEITGSPFCPFAPISVPFVTNGTYAQDNIFTVQLSNQSGSFSNPTALVGNLSGTTSGVISAFMLEGIPEGIGYKVRVVSSNPVIIGSENGTYIEILNSTDADNDGWSVCGGDCDDNNNLIYPGRTEICNGINDDCDFRPDGTPLIDEDFIIATQPGVIQCTDEYGNLLNCDGFACRNTTHYYQVAPQQGVTFTWTAPYGATVTAASETAQTLQTISNTVTVNFSNQFSAGILSVVATGNCGATPPDSHIDISSFVQQLPQFITGGPNSPTTVCRRSTHTYRCSPVQGIPPNGNGNYIWTAPGGAQIQSGQGTRVVSIRFGNNGGNVSVCGVVCGTNGLFANLPVTVNNCNRTSSDIEDNDWSLSIYPNPATNHLELNFTSAASESTLEIYSTLGQRIMSKAIHADENGEYYENLDISNFTKGIYLMRVVNETGTAEQKFVKE